MKTNLIRNEKSKSYITTEFESLKPYQYNITFYYDIEEEKAFTIEGSLGEINIRSTNEFVPNISWNKYDREFQIQTTAYGSGNIEFIKKIIAGFEEATEAVEVLNDLVLAHSFITIKK
ncbi:hypothetical protein [Clostridium sp.]|uniref:hypothetical protein n=1 Tax=Clostridium sp. TaxID=1506 RepID=UPI001A4B1678|nr:hypothetical protein [Clostridium sp.]MBK5234082.1 hypothetical protein [Clostridium sp.]